MVGFYKKETKKSNIKEIKKGVRLYILYIKYYLYYNLII